ncbi:hypothetical protein EOM82_01745 [bacterium]|nr:hypothetical protein [bacterium]
MSSKKILLTIVFVLILTFSLLACEGIGEITINGFSVDYSNVDMDLEIGEDVDLSKLVVTATKSDGTTITLKEGEDFTIDLGDFDKTTPGEYTIKVKYKDFPEKTFVVEVKEATNSAVLTGIAVATDSTHKTVFAYDEAFSSANLVLTATYDDESTARITEGFTLNSSEYNKAHGQASEQSYSITVSYNTKTTTYSVSVAADPSKIIKGISASGEYRTSYNYYEDFSSAGLLLEVTMMDDSKTYLNNGFDINSNAFNKLHGLGEAQTYDIAITYMSKSTSYEVTVARAKVIDLYIVDTDKLDFKYGEAFDLGTAKIYAKYENSLYTELLTPSAEFGNGYCVVDSSNYNSEHETSVEQEYDIVVYYSQEVYNSYEVSVASMPLFTEYRVAAGSTHRTEFARNETFTSAGLIVEAVFGSEQDGDLFIKTLTEGYTITTPSFEGTTPNYYGFYQINVSVANIASGNSFGLYFIYVTDASEEIDYIEATFLGGEANFYQGSELNLEYYLLTVYLVGGDSYTIPLPNSLVTVTGYDSSEIGENKELSFSYKDVEPCTASYNIIADEIDYVYVDNDYFRTDYYFGEPIDYSGIIVYEVYLSGRREVKADYDKQSNYDPFTSGSYEVLIEGMSYYVQVYDFQAATNVTNINLQDNDNNYLYAEEETNGRWKAEVANAGEYLLNTNLGDDYISTYDVMLGEYTFGGVFLALAYESGGYIIDYSGIGDLIVTIRITNANGNVSYNYLTITKETAYFSEFTINGEEIQLSVASQYLYYINNVSNSYVIDWTIDSKYTVTGASKGNVVNLDSYDYSMYLKITIKEGSEELAVYEIVIVPFVLISSITIGDVSANKETQHSQTSFAANISDIYGAQSYDVDIAVPQGFIAVLKLLGVAIESIDSDMLFVGANYFTVEVFDNEAKLVAEYDLKVIINNPSFLPQYALISKDSNNIASLSQYQGGDYTQTVYVTYEALEIEQSYALTFYWAEGMPAGTVVAIEGEQFATWTNGGSFTLNSGRNQLVFTVSDGTNSYRTYLIIYAEVEYPVNNDWQNVELYLVGVQANRTNAIPVNNDIFVITIPNGYDFYTDITDNIVLKSYNDIDLSPYSFSYEVNQEHDRVRIIVTDSVTAELLGYLYLIITYDGEVNSDTTLLVYHMTMVEAMMGEFINPVEFQPNAENENRMEATVTTVINNYIVFVYPDFASCVAVASLPDAITLVEDFVCMITYTGTESFVITFEVTSSDKLATETYYLTVNMGEEEDVFSLSFGGEGYLELGFTLSEMYALAMENDGEIIIDIPTLQINEEDFDTVNNTVAFVLNSTYTCVEMDTVTEIANGVKHTIDMIFDEENSVYTVQFYLCLDETFSADASAIITLYFHLPVASISFSDGTILTQYMEFGDLMDEDFNLVIYLTQAEYEAKLDGENKFYLDAVFYMPNFVCYYDEVAQEYLEELNHYEVVFDQGIASVMICERSNEQGREDSFMPLTIYITDPVV